MKGAHLMWRGLISCEGGSSHVKGAHLIWRGLISSGGGSSHVKGAHLMWRGLISCEGGSSVLYICSVLIALLYRMHFNFRRIYMSLIFHICGFRILNSQMLAIVLCVSIDVLIFVDNTFADGC